MGTGIEEHALASDRATQIVVKEDGRRGVFGKKNGKRVLSILESRHDT